MTMGQLNDVRERVRKASGFVEQLRQMERVRETILRKYLEQFNSIAETASVAAADEDGHLFRAADAACAKPKTTSRASKIRGRALKGSCVPRLRNWRSYAVKS